ncbi:MAG: hypothetical protein Q8941_06815 [Bacteroidota bacterium]|nr:hypothetical protein [Bacteroidota bacterium]
MSYIAADVEPGGPILNKYPMVCFGAAVVEPSLSKTFYGKTTHDHHPVNDAKGNAEALLAMKQMGLRMPSN